MAPPVNNSFTRKIIFKSKKDSKKFKMKDHNFYDLTDDEIKLIFDGPINSEEEAVKFARTVIKLFRSKNR